MTEKKQAYDFLKDAADQLGIKAQLRDQPQGERSMAKTVATFNAATGHTLTESDGWKFMVFLKMIRGQQGKFNADDYIDGAAYFGLLGECESGTERNVGLLPGANVQTPATPISTDKNSELPK
jgi:hypothetical protein